VLPCPWAATAADIFTLAATAEAQEGGGKLLEEEEKGPWEYLVFVDCRHVIISSRDPPHFFDR
jgi:hypothetical protein